MWNKLGKLKDKRNDNLGWDELSFLSLFTLRPYDVYTIWSSQVLVRLDINDNFCCKRIFVFFFILLLTCSEGNKHNIFFVRILFIEIHGCVCESAKWNDKVAVASPKYIFLWSFRHKNVCCFSNTSSVIFLVFARGSMRNVDHLLTWRMFRRIKPITCGATFLLPFNVSQISIFWGCRSQTTTHSNG